MPFWGVYLKYRNVNILSDTDCVKGRLDSVIGQKKPQTLVYGFSGLAPSIRNPYNIT